MLRAARPSLQRMWRRSGEEEEEQARERAPNRRRRRVMHGQGEVAASSSRSSKHDDEELVMLSWTGAFTDTTMSTDRCEGRHGGYRGPASSAPMLFLDLTPHTLHTYTSHLTPHIFPPVPLPDNATSRPSRPSSSRGDATPSSGARSRIKTR